jgi:hypothetical protein
MVGLSRTRAVDNLLSRLCAKSSETDPASVRMATTVPMSPRAGAVEVIPRWVTGQDTA